MTTPVLEPATMAHHRSRPVLRAVRLTAGGILLPVGIVLGISPIPVGFILIPLSLYLLAGESQTARSAICWVRRHLPPMDKGLRAVAHRVPRGVMHMIRDTDPRGGCSCTRCKTVQAGSA